MADLLKCWRHLFSAVLALGARTSPVDQRLREAYVNELQKLSPQDDLPEDLQAEFRKLMDELAETYQGSGAVDERQASRLAKRVVVIYDRVTKKL